MIDSSPPMSQVLVGHSEEPKSAKLSSQRASAIRTSDKIKQAKDQEEFHIC